MISSLTLGSILFLLNLLFSTELSDEQQGTISLVTTLEICVSVADLGFLF